LFGSVELPLVALECTGRYTRQTVVDEQVEQHFNQRQILQMLMVD